MDYSGYCNAALRKVAPPGRSFDGVGSEGTLQAGHVRSLFSANQIRGLKSVRQIIEVRFIKGTIRQRCRSIKLMKLFNI